MGSGIQNKNLWEAVKIVTNENLLGIYDAKC